MKLSLRTQKLNSQNFEYRIDHNSRVTFSKSADSSKSKNNINFTSKHFQNSIENLWNYIRADFVEKKSQNIISKNKRFLKRNSTKTTKDKNGNKTFSQTETSILREFVIQLGNEKEGFFSAKDSQNYYKQIQDFIAKKYKLTVLKSDLHLDEKVPHLHIIATSYSFETGEFSKEFNKKNSYETMQKEVFKFCNDELNLELEGYQKKECLGADYIAPAVYKREKEVIEKAQEFCQNKDFIEKQLSEARETILKHEATISSQKYSLSSYEQSMSDLELQNKELQSEVTQTLANNEELYSVITSLNAERSERERALQTKLNEVVKRIESYIPEASKASITFESNSPDKKFIMLMQHLSKQFKKLKVKVENLENELKTYRGTDRQEKRSEVAELSSLYSPERSEINVNDVEQFITDSTGADRKKAKKYLSLRVEFDKFVHRPDWQRIEDINIQELQQELLEAEQELLKAGFKPSEKNEVLANYNPNDFISQQDEQGNDIQPLFV